MKLPNWFKIVWWFLLTGGLSFFMWQRLADLVGGKATLFDIVAFVVWVCLVLAPVFVEIEIMGISLKQEIASVKSHVDRQVKNLRADIHNSVNVRSQFSPQITFSTPPSDAQLPNIQEQLKETLEGALKTHGLSHQPKPDEKPPEVPPDNLYFFQVRYSVEKELQRIWKTRFASQPSQRALLASVVLPSLVDAQLISPDIAKAIRDVYAVCSPAIHGQEVTEAQRRFVREVVPDLISTLRAIE